MTTQELERYIADELVQREEEGYEVGSLKERWQTLTALGVASDRKTLEGFVRDLEALDKEPKRFDFPYIEPSDCEGIRASLPPFQLSNIPPCNLTDAELHDRILGAWQGRVAGCMLGKPVEGWHKERIERYLKAANAYPLRSYLPLLETEDPQLQIGFKNSLTLGNVKFGVRDDDIDYTVLALHLVQVRGTDFTSEHVGQEWLAHLPFHCVYTAERCAYRNLVNGMKPPQTATYRNPYREWIGAQIRADLFGYVSPANPEKAARMAFNDAALSHVKNGIYGEMWVAAMIAGAFVSSDVEEVIKIGLSQIPKDSRLAEAINDALKWRQQFSDWEEAWQQANEKYGRYHFVHTINNAVLVALGLLYGEMDYTKTVGYAVMGGWDCDCNGATAGSVLGAMLGEKNLPKDWIEPLNDTYHSALSGFAELKISELAQQTFELARKELEAE